MNCWWNFIFSFRQLVRQSGAAVRLLILLPFSQILPILFMGSTFLQPTQLQWFFYTNLAWGFLASCALEALVWLQMVMRSTRLDTILLVDGGVRSWGFGFTLALNLLYICSTALSSLVIALGLGYPLQALHVLAALTASTPVSVGIIFFILGAELRFGRILHIANSALDGLLIVSGVMYSLSILGPLLGGIGRLTPWPGSPNISVSIEFSISSLLFSQQ